MLAEFGLLIFHFFSFCFGGAGELTLNSSCTADVMPFKPGITAKIGRSEQVDR